MQRLVPLHNVLVLFVCTLCLSACTTLGSHSPATLILTNARVYTVDASRSEAEAVAIAGQRILLVGSSAEVMALAGPDTDVRDLDGALVLPGLHDMHIHALGIVEPDQCDLGSKALSLAAMVPVLQGCLDRYQIAPGDWLVVTQWAFSGGNAPSRDLPNIRAALDAVSTQHPIFVWGDDGHHGAANSLALAQAAIPGGERIALDATTLNTVYARYETMVATDADGHLTGGLNEDARALLRPNLLADMLGMGNGAADALPRVAARLAENGITSIQDAMVTPDTLTAYADLERSGNMSFRLRAAMVEPATEAIADIDAHLEALKHLQRDLAGSRLVHASAVKLFADGVLEGNPLTNPPTLPVAGILRPFKQPVFAGSISDGSFHIASYVDPASAPCRQVREHPPTWLAPAAAARFHADHGHYPSQCVPASGILEHDEAFIRAYIRKATEAGFHVHVHALAERGIRIAVDEFARVKATADRLGTTQSLAHVQLAHPDDQQRIGELGISVVFTFVWTHPDVQYEMMVAPFIDEVSDVDDMYNPAHYYMANVYPARRIEEAGGVLVHGSDAPVGSRDPMPFASLAMALMRSDGTRVMNATQRIDIHSAIAAFTINGARLFGHADRVGSIEAGKLADLIVLDRDIITLAERGEAPAIIDTKITLTVFDGAVVHDVNEANNHML